MKTHSIPVPSSSLDSDSEYVPISEAIPSPKDRRLYVKLASEIADANSQISELEKTKEILKKEIKLLISKLKLPAKIQGPGWKDYLVITVRTSIIPEKLLERGVDMDTIDYATQKKETISRTIKRDPIGE